MGSEDRRPPRNVDELVAKWPPETRRVVDWLVELLNGDYGINLGRNMIALQRLNLKEAAERATAELGSAREAMINLPFITATPDGPIHFEVKLTAHRFQNLTADLRRDQFR